MPRPQGNRTRAAVWGFAALVLTVAVSSLACQRDTTASSHTGQPTRAEVHTITVPVDGMICMVCAGSVKNALQAVRGVQKAEVDLAKRNVTVQYEHAKVSVDELTRAINQLGYKAGVPTPAQSQ